MRRNLRAIPIGLLALAAAGLAPHSLATAQGIASLDTSAPVNYGADQIELQDKANRVVLSGDVLITQGNLTVRAARATVAYTDADELRIQRLDATGGVTLRRGNDTLQGGRLVIDLKSGLASVDGHATGQTTGRVSGTFTVPK